jgi:hypothetical protein
MCRKMGLGAQLLYPLQGTAVDKVFGIFAVHCPSTAEMLTVYVVRPCPHTVSIVRYAGLGSQPTEIVL